MVKASNILGHKNQYMIVLPDGSIAMQSYNTHIATAHLYDDGVYTLNMISNTWSVTTAKHFKHFLDCVYMLNAVNSLLDNKVFKNFKDFMYRCKSLRVTRYECSCVYLDKDRHESSYEISLK